MPYVLEREQCFPRPLEDVFAFFADAGNLEAVTPPFLHFRILSPLPIEMKPGALIDYSLRLYGWPVRWRTAIDSWDPPRAFSDRQLRGPYKRWFHTHTFEAIPGGTRMRDRVEYDLGWGPAGRMAHALMVRRSLAQIFDYRWQVMAKEFGTLENA